MSKQRRRALRSRVSLRTPAVLGAYAVLVLSSCKGSEARSSSPVPELASAPAPATLLSGAPPPKAPFEARMRDHALHGVTIRDAVIRGDFVSARAHAQLLVERSAGADPEPRMAPRLEAMTIAARQIGDAADVDESARGLAALAASCGSCHATFGGPRLLVGEAPPDSNDSRARMVRHQWAAARLWEGLVVPSNEAWTRGARVLEDAPLDPALLTPGMSPVPKVGALASTVHELGRKATATEGSVRRADVYGQLAATCASCHALLRGGPRR